MSIATLNTSKADPAGNIAPTPEPSQETVPAQSLPAAGPTLPSRLASSARDGWSRLRSLSSSRRNSVPEGLTLPGTGGGVATARGASLGARRATMPGPDAASSYHSATENLVQDLRNAGNGKTVDGGSGGAGDDPAVGRANPGNAVTASNALDSTQSPKRPERRSLWSRMWPSGEHLALGLVLALPVALFTTLPFAGVFGIGLLGDVMLLFLLIGVSLAAVGLFNALAFQRNSTAYKKLASVREHETLPADTRAGGAA